VKCFIRNRNKSMLLISADIRISINEWNLLWNTHWKYLHIKTCRYLQFEVPKIKNVVVLYNRANIIFFG